ncbi:11786_t:CDS:2 [Diversispora eburnea]|uniref:11786_t:CDS:1 n=1 Tax=Diversispora eburnea TaxID=1213867 RepID=A0A9N8ZQB5_9GLOM|nr:11786_t:CDS:2 [Diversispora eburnea]
MSDIKYSHLVDSKVANEIGKKVGAFFAQEAGFTNVTPTAYEALGNLTKLFLSNLIQTSRAYAELACRAQPNIHDIEKSLKDRNIRTGALEGKDNYHKFALELSSILKPTSTSTTIIKFVPEDIIVEKPKNKRQRRSSSFASSFRPSYVPSYMPPFPKLSLEQVKLVEKSLQKLTRHNEEPILIHSNIPESPLTSSTVVSANSSPIAAANDDPSSIRLSISNFDSTILHTGKTSNILERIMYTRVNLKEVKSLISELDNLLR